MNRATFLPSLLLAVSPLLAPGLHAADANGTWTPTTAGPFLWSAGGNWSGSTVADGVGFTAFFTPNITADQTAALDSVRSIGNITFTDSTTSSNNLTISNNGNAANILTLDVATGAPIIDVTQTGRRLTISAQIAGSDGLTKNGLGIVHLTNNSSSYTGATTINAGMLDFGGIATANIGGGAGAGRNITVASGAAVRFNAVSNALLNRIVETSDEIIIMTGGTANSFDFSSSTGANLSGAFLSNYASNGAKAEISGTITPGGGAYRLGSLLGSGALGITNTSPLSGSNQLIIGGNRVVLVGAKTFTGDTTIRNGGILGLAGLNTDAGAAKNHSLALQNSVLDLGAPAGTGRLFLESGVTAGFITGATSTANGGTTSATFGGLAGSRNLNSAFLFTAPGNNTSATTAVNITGFTLNVGTGNTVTYSGAIGGFGTGASAGLNGASTLTKTGVGTQVLTGTHTYTGATLVSNGTLSIDGAGSLNNSAVTVNGGTFRYNSSVAYTGTFTFTTGTLAGTNMTGSLGGQTIGANQILSPGNSPGTASTTGQTWAGGGSYLWEVNNATGTAGSDPGWDLVTGTGALNITATSGSPFELLVTSLTLANASGLAVLFDDTLAYNWLIADFNAVTNFSADAFTINTSGFQNSYTGTFGVALGGGSLPGDNSQIYLTYAPIPEPAAALLTSLGLLALFRRRRN